MGSRREDREDVVERKAVHMARPCASSVQIDYSRHMVAHRSTTSRWVGPQKNEAIHGCLLFWARCFRRR